MEDEHNSPDMMTADEEDPLLGTQLGSFRLVRRLGRGGMGTVYLGEHVSIGSRMAVKVLHEHLAAYPELVQRFHAEARAVNLIGHENIVSIFDLNSAPPRPYLIMEYLEGVPLSSMVGTPVKAEVWIPILSQACEALHAAHLRGIVHRDLKPDNIFLVQRAKGAPPFVKVLDFGIAKLIDGAGPQTQAGIIVGTPEYMSPEQSRSLRLDGRADVYSLGVIAYQMATGRLPFMEEGTAAQLVAHQTIPPPPPRSIYAGVSIPVDAVILRSLAKSLTDRYENALALKAALEAALAEELRGPPPEPPPAPPPPVASPVRETPSRRRARPVELPARVVLRPGAQPERLVCSDIARGGLFLRTQGELPPLFSRVQVTLELGRGALTANCEVVRLVTPEQALLWGMAPGFGVQFVDASADFKAAIDQLLKGGTGNTPQVAVAEPSKDVEAEVLLEGFRTNLQKDHYSLLSLPQDANLETIRTRVRVALGELEGLKGRPLSSSQRALLESVLTRVRDAGETLTNVTRRAMYDALLGNFRGVESCLSAGLTVTQLEALRKDFLVRRPNAAGTARVHILTGNAYEKNGQLARAVEAYERGLAVDPLDLALLQRYRALRRALSSRPSP
ncbi:protein kinase domain-containing protein [Hyalangium minutum]|uniref:Serine/threonine-protein kinase pkn1 n=1 Tax=Hyalangium minutum TaxID=394096 RepID=A0A085WJ53_9BACT|nr:protein kinase [Hyalangium minutum]KFE67716.1 Serine/threonine-protein kinase pkn1 [Hyalangium minutum]